MYNRKPTKITLIAVALIFAICIVIGYIRSKI